MKRVWIFLLAALLLCAAGCGGNGDAQRASDGPVPLSQYLAGGDTVWYEVKAAEGIGPETPVGGEMLIRADGTVSIAVPDQMTLADVVEKTAAQAEADFQSGDAYRYALALRTDGMGGKDLVEQIIVCLPMNDDDKPYDADPMNIAAREEDSSVEVQGVRFAAFGDPVYPERVLLTPTDALIVLDEPAGENGLPLNVEVYESLFQ